jgi:hypothetical protein
VTTLIPVSLVNCGKSGAIAVDQGWIAPASEIVWPANCFQSIAALAQVAAAASAKLIVAACPTKRLRQRPTL